MSTPEAAGTWTSRIVGHDRVAPAELTANPLNHRTHPPRQRKVIEGSIEEIGFVRSVTVNRVTGHLVDGHERVRQAIETGQMWIDVEYVELTAEEERKALAILDRSSELAEIDSGALERLLGQTTLSDDALRELAAEMAAEAQMCIDGAGSSAEPVLGDMQYSIVVECSDEREQASLLERFESEGLTCRAMIA